MGHMRRPTVDDLSIEDVPGDDSVVSWLVRLPADLTNLFGGDVLFSGLYVGGVREKIVAYFTPAPGNPTPSRMISIFDTDDPHEAAEMLAEQIGDLADRTEIHRLITSTLGPGETSLATLVHRFEMSLATPPGGDWDENWRAHWRELREIVAAVDLALDRMKR